MAYRQANIEMAMAAAAAAGVFCGVMAGGVCLNISNRIGRSVEKGARNKASAGAHTRASAQYQRNMAAKMA